MNASPQIEPASLTLEDAVAQLIVARGVVLMVNTAYEELMQSEEYRSATAACDAALSNYRAAEALVRDLAVAAYEASGSKKLHGGIGIRVMNDIVLERPDGSYVPKHLMVQWAREVAPALVVVEETVNLSGAKELIRALPEANRPEWARIDTRIVATFPKELKV